MFIKTLAALQRHTRTFDRARLAHDFSVRCAGVGDRPFGLIVEQPGVWLYPSYRWRLALLREAVEGAELDLSASGLYFLETDSFSSNGAKKSLTFIDWSAEIGELSVLRRSTRLRFEHRSYESIMLSDDDLQPLYSTLLAVKSLVSAAKESKREFFAAARMLKNAPRPSSAPALVHGEGKWLWPSYESFAALDLDKLLVLLQRWQASCVGPQTWVSLWSDINKTVLGPIRSAAPMWRRLLQEVESPHALASAQATLEQGRDRLVVPLAHSFDAAGRRAVIAYELESRRCIKRAHGESEELVDWDDVRSGVHGACQLSGFGSYVVLAALGGYLILDPGDPVVPFQKLAQRVVKHVTSNDFPWVMTTLAGGNAPESVAAYRNDFVADLFSSTGSAVADILVRQFVVPRGQARRTEFATPK